MNTPTGTLVITGATRGLGLAAVQRLLLDQPDLHLLLITRGNQGVALSARLTARTGNPNLSTLPCDLSSLRDVRTVADAICAQLDTGALPPLRGLLGNAGVQLSSAATTTADGYETTFAVNVLAHYALLRLLLDRFTEPARIILTSSATHFGDFAHNYALVPGPRWADTGRLARPSTAPAANTRVEGYTAYATSKLALIYLVHALARRLPPGIEAYSYSPGLVPGTGIVRDSGPMSRSLFRAVMPILQLSSRIAMGPEVAGSRLAATLGSTTLGPSGSYIDRGHLTPSAPESYNQDREEELWHTAATLCDLPR